MITNWTQANEILHAVHTYAAFPRKCNRHNYTPEQIQAARDFIKKHEAAAEARANAMMSAPAGAPLRTPEEHAAILAGSMTHRRGR